MTTARRTAHTSRPAATLALYAASCLALAAYLDLTRPDLHDDRTSFWVLSALSLPVVVLVVLLVQHLPRHPLTLTLAAGLVLTATGQGPALLAEAVEPGSGLAAALTDLGWLGGIPMLPLMFLFFPNGWPSGPWRWLARAEVAAFVALVFVSASHGFAEPGRLATATAATGAAILVVGALVGAVRLLVRAVRERGSHPGHTAFAAVAALAVVCWFALPVLDAVVGLPGALIGTLTYASLAFGPQLALGYGVLRHQLFGLDVVIRRVALAATSAVVIFAIYLLGVLAVGALLDVPRSTLAAGVLPAAIAVVVLAPAHRRAQVWAERRLYGDRRDPHSLLTHLATELASVPPDEVAHLVATRTAEGLRLPWTAVELDREGTWVQVAEHGSGHEGPVEIIEVTHAGEVVGRLLTRPRRGQPALGSRDLAALHQVTVQAAPALSAARLVDELTQSRERLVLGREQERNRLRRELHDGLSPSLAGMSLALGAARRGLGSTLPPEAARLLDTVQRESVQAAQAVRDLLADLRPPGLEELGLVGALEDRARQLTREQEFDIAVLADALPPLAPSVEVAAYRIATEAMTNAARHSGGRHCQVQVSANGRLEVIVVDDGHGLGPEAAGHGGVGLESMAERAHELGGELTVQDGPDGGTMVRALLPVVGGP